ncbi:dTDP-4-dehydrorhamnose reductase [Rhodococcus sp. X156]|uniref:dTDP-4-dehydrorhamnose reductase n=1 Tax=Rhodococcus sp. X156 TaxID=2499145 RepID=UPI000FD7849F|nr:dTDP-4-dehydrorhamnose reductase [Rhodococcus sp. X156]
MSSPDRLSLLVTGAKGQLGTDVVEQALAAGHQVRAAASADLDVTDAAAVHAAVAELADGEQLAVVVNCAAHTAVDAAEDEPAAAAAVNTDAPGHLARACAAHGVHLVHVSTDYVFPGDASRPYEPGDPTGPRSVYGRTKLAGEQAVLAALPSAHVVRTAWVYGAHGSNFVATMLRLEATHDTLRVVDDQRGSPTWSADLAAGLLELATRRDLPGGVLHATNSGDTTWCGLARAVFAEVGADPERVHPCRTEEFPRPAPRPAYSVLSAAAWTAAGLTPLRPWEQALHAALAQGGVGR